MGMQEALPHILMVEDNLALCQGWSELLELLGYRISCCQQAQDALRLLEGDAAFDLVFSDYYLPDMNGVDFIRQARHLRPALPAVVLTGSRENFIENAVETLGDASILYKPLNIEALEAEILRLCGSAPDEPSTQG